ncbi:ACT domain-containing protein [Streptococcus pneumoniae]|uniref:ACT domain-containing protein n=2 Tax=Bacteria TaxID=2 RepID=UPI0007666748|nr:ACT domain-containing protein [Streptococcus pneumoniae]CVY92869.1 ACT domain-containing protein [Streptococcus pneumoniae]CWG20141.1 ACT domain-containing protein [Streptococcus pneumoniae]
MGLFFYNKIGSIISIVDLPTIDIIEPDKSGIVAGVSGKIAELGLNIDDISQTVLDEYFTMMAVVSSDEKQDFTYLRNEFEAFGQTLNVKINIQSAAIFEAMYNI